jgi:branched-chain amino acid transport system permease protein
VKIAVRRALTRALPIAVLALVVGVIAEGVGSISELIARIVTLGLVTMVAVIGVYIFTGNSGVVSFGHMSFMLVGAYVSGLLTVPVMLKHVTLPNLPAWLAGAHVSGFEATIIAGLAGVAFALVLSPSLMRLAGLSASIASFALLMIVQIVASQWTSVTAGYGTFVGVPIDTTVTGAFIWVVIAIGSAYLFQTSRFGLMLRASRDDPVAAVALGISVVQMRAMAFLLSAFFVAVAGSLYAHVVSAFSTNAFYIDETFIVIAMLVVGGLRSLSGAVVGPIIVTVVTQVLTVIENGVTVGNVTIMGPVGMTQVGLAIAILVVLILRPSGVVGDGEHAWMMRFANRRHHDFAPARTPMMAGEPLRGDEHQPKSAGAEDPPHE